MNLKSIGIGMALGATIALAGGAYISQPEEGGMGMPSPEEMAEMMAEMERLGSPGPHHEALNQFVGEWDTTMRMWWGGPGSEAEESSGHSSIKWILDGRFVQEDMTSTFTMPGPDGGMMEMEFRGMGLTGYDNFRNMYVSSWADNMTTQLIVGKGVADPRHAVFTHYCEMDEPTLDVVGRLVRIRNRVINEDRWVMEMYDLHAGEDYKVMEITYQRSQ